MARRSGQVGYEEVKRRLVSRQVSHGCSGTREADLPEQADLPRLVAQGF
jgi:hypothetical protein